MKAYYHQLTDPDVGPIGPRSDRAIISSIKLEEGVGHDIVHVWNRGGNAGRLFVEKGDGEAIAERLLPSVDRRAP